MNVQLDWSDRQLAIGMGCEVQVLGVNRWSGKLFEHRLSPVFDYCCLWGLHSGWQMIWSDDVCAIYVHRMRPGAIVDCLLARKFLYRLAGSRLIQVSDWLARKTDWLHAVWVGQEPPGGLGLNGGGHCEERLVRLNHASRLECVWWAHKNHHFRLEGDDKWTPWNSIPGDLKCVGPSEEPFRRAKRSGWNFSFEKRYTTSLMSVISLAFFRIKLPFKNRYGKCTIPFVLLCTMWNKLSLSMRSLANGTVGSSRQQNKSI